MKAKYCLALIILLFFPISAQNEFLKVELRSDPRSLARGSDAILLIKIEPRQDLKVLLYPEFVIRFEEDQNFSFNKSFFTGNELAIETETVEQLSYFKFQEELKIPFLVNENAFLGTQILSGEITYTVMFRDNWSVKTSQKISIPLSVVREKRKRQ